MARFLFFLLTLTLIAAGAAWLSDSPGDVIFTWQGYRVEMTISIFVAGLLLLMLVVMGIWNIIFTVIYSPRRWSAFYASRQQNLGLQALTEAFAALAISDLSYARKQSDKARRLLHEAPLSLLLSAQLARLEGKDEEMRKYLERMLKNPETEFVAMRGLVETQRKRGRIAEASELAKRAHKLRPQDKGVVLALLDLYAREHRFQEAVALLDKAYRKRTINTAEYKHIWSITHFTHGRVLYGDMRLAEALPFLSEAHKKDPGFTPASVLLAEALNQSGKREAAIKLLNQSWKHAPHPELVKTLLMLVREEPAEKQYKRIEKMTSYQPEHLESLIARGQAALAAHQIVTARNYLEQAYQKENSVRIARLLAEVAAHDPGGKDASEWLAKAARALPDAAWTCTACGHISEKWQPHCERCDTFDSIIWMRRVTNALPNLT